MVRGFRFLGLGHRFKFLQIAVIVEQDARTQHTYKGHDARSVNNVVVPVKKRQGKQGN